MLKSRWLEIRESLAEVGKIENPETLPKESSERTISQNIFWFSKSLQSSNNSQINENTALNMPEHGIN